MKYELAKELKDAGFLTKEGAGGYFGQNGDDGYYSIPTLSELIEACGEGFECLFNWGKESKGWEASTEESTKYPEISTYGDTPEEAVARLYLALNKK